jgi:hypothetical protein
MIFDRINGVDGRIQRLPTPYQFPRDGGRAAMANQYYKPTPLDRIRRRCLQIGDCFVWQGSTTSNGYGHIWIDGHCVRVHRFVYEAAHGPIPEHFEVDHVRDRGCRFRTCCNVTHLEAVTHRENTLRSDSFSAREARQTHCLRGHLLEGSNLKPSETLRGHRGCRLCAGIRDQRRRPRHRIRDEQTKRRRRERNWA